MKMFMKFLLWKFAEKCPQGKRGRPMSMSPEVAEQKGIQVCEKQTRDGRTIAYKTGQQLAKEKESKSLTKEARQKSGLKQRGRLSQSNKEKIAQMVEELRGLTKKEEPTKKANKDNISPERFKKEIDSLTQKINQAHQLGNDVEVEQLRKLRDKVINMSIRENNKNAQFLSNSEISPREEEEIVMRYQDELKKKRPNLSKHANQFYAQLYYDWQHPKGSWTEHHATLPIFKKISKKTDEEINKFVEENWDNLLLKYESGTLFDAMVTIGIIKKYNIPHDYNVIFNDSFVKILSESGDIDNDLEKDALKTVNEFPWGAPLLKMNSQEIDAMEKRRVKEIKDKMGIN